MELGDWTGWRLGGSKRDYRLGEEKLYRKSGLHLPLNRSTERLFRARCFILRALSGTAV